MATNIRNLNYKGQSSINKISSNLETNILNKYQHKLKNSSITLKSNAKKKDKIKK